PRMKIHGNTHAPQRLKCVWVRGLSFRAIVECIQQKFTVFNPQVIPLRATLSVTFREYKTLEEQLADLNLQSSDHSKQRIAQLKDTLSRIAFDEHGDSSTSRLIADDPANAETAANP